MKQDITTFKQLDIKYKILFIFIISIIFSFLILLIEILLEFLILKHDIENNSFLTQALMNYKDIFQDFFNVNKFVANGSNPYTSIYNSSYPPLILLVAKFFALFGDYSNQSFDVRNSFLGLFVYFVFVIINIISIYFAITYYLNKKNINKNIKYFFLIACILSLPFCYLIIRGNYLLLALNFLLWFFVLYDSEKKSLRELSLVFLAISAGIKIYPALFALILFKEKRYLDFFKTVIYTILLFFIPFLFFSGGFSNIKVFFTNLIDFQGIREVSDHNYSIATFLYCVNYILSGFKNAIISDWMCTVGRILSYIVFIIGMLCALFSNKRWKCFTLISLVVLLFPAPSFIYSAVVLIVPISCFLFEESHSKRDWFYLICFIILFSSLQLGFLIPPEHIKYGINLMNFIQLFTIIILFVVLCFDSIKYMIYKFKNYKKIKLNVNNTN